MGDTLDEYMRSLQMQTRQRDVITRVDPEENGSNGANGAAMQQNEAAAVQAAQAAPAVPVRTLRDEIKKVLTQRGISTAVGVEVVTQSGEQFTVLSESSPHMDMPADEIRQISVKQSARAGLALAARAGGQGGF